MSLSSMYPTIMSERVVETRDFYTTHLGFELTFEADWYVSLKRSDASYELAILDHQHESIPAKYRKLTQGMVLNFEVSDVDTEYERVVTKGGVSPELKVKDEAWGQRHFIIADPNGVLIDVIQPIPPSAEFAEQYVG